jgi:hypothetical protein
MPPALAYAPAAEPDLLAAFANHTERLGLRGADHAKALGYSCAAGPTRRPGPPSRYRFVLHCRIILARS